MAVKEPIDLNVVKSAMSSLVTIAEQMHSRGKSEQLGSYIAQMKKVLNADMGIPSVAIDLQAAKVSVASMFSKNASEQTEPSLERDDSVEQKGPQM